jgi:DNA-binding NarL/FixJ family response regulator
MRVILADDSDLILVHLRGIVSRYENVKILGSYKNGTDTLEAIKTLRPDLAIVDIRMPGMSGIEVLKKIREVDKTVKFIILTFYSSDYYKKLAIQAGADYFFSKVDDFDKISPLVATLLDEEENSKRTRIINSKFAVIMELQQNF